MAAATTAAARGPERKSVELAARKRRFSINVVVAHRVAAPSCGCCR